MHHFSPHQLPARPCWHCTDYLGLIPGGSVALCARGGIRALPGRGCAFWVRETGTDDEPQPAVGSMPPRTTVTPSATLGGGSRR